jgi:hypothetical protein
MAAPPDVELPHAPEPTKGFPRVRIEAGHRINNRPTEKSRNQGKKSKRDLTIVAAS